jgi:rhodanese-related sulfurtransferase
MRIRFISKEQLLEMMENGDDFVLVDARRTEDFEKGHIPSAKSLPAGRVGAAHEDILGDKTRTVVTYCGDFQCHASTNAAKELMRLGYGDVRDYKGGRKDWDAAGLPIVTGKQ